MRAHARMGALVLVAAPLGLLSCGSEPGAAADKPAPSTHTVTIEAVAYSPATVTVNVGDKVVWVNKDPFPHTATSQAAGFDSKDIGASDASWTYTATKPGEFSYLCTLHPTMTGVLRVKP